jgi:hypothetical protein
MVITRGHLGGMLISLVAVDRIKDACAAAVLEDETKAKGIQYLFESFALHHRLTIPQNVSNCGRSNQSNTMTEDKAVAASCSDPSTF